jgi:hypothetical protein
MAIYAVTMKRKAPTMRAIQRQAIALFIEIFFIMKLFYRQA